MTQQFSSYQVSLSPAREHETIVEKTPPVLDHTSTHIHSSQSNTGTTLQQHKDRFAQWNVCHCPKEFQENYRPYNTDYTENQCMICGNLSDRRYD